MRMWGNLCGRMGFMSGRKQIGKYWWGLRLCNVPGESYVMSCR